MVKSNSGKIDLEDLTILDWIRDLIPPRSEEEQRLLKEDIRANKQTTAIVITDIDGHEDVVIDGHGRVEIFRELDGREFEKIKFVRREYANRQAIENEMLRIQLGRRNLSENAKSLLRAKIWSQEKQERRSSKQEVASSLSVTERTLTNDVKLAKAADTLRSAVPGSEEFINDPTTPKTVITEAAKVAAEDPHLAREIISEVSKGSSKDEKSKILKLEQNKKERRSSFTKKSLKSVSWKFDPSLLDKINLAAKESGIKTNQFVENIVKEYLADV